MYMTVDLTFGLSNNLAKPSRASQSQSSGLLVQIEKTPSYMAWPSARRAAQNVSRFTSLVGPKLRPDWLGQSILRPECDGSARHFHLNSTSRTGTPLSLRRTHPDSSSLNFGEFFSWKLRVAVLPRQAEE